MQLYNEAALGHLCATWVLEVSTGKSSWGRTSNPQEAVLCLGEGVGTHTHTHTRYTHITIITASYKDVL